MAQIFVSHSGKDRELVDYFSNMFASTKVKAIFEEFEKISTREITTHKIEQDIDNSNAVFVILSMNVQAIPHTRDWVNWETGASKNKDIWVFEPYTQLGRISIATPRLTHYVIFDTNESYFDYIKKIIETYDDSHVLPTLISTTGAGALMGQAGGAVIGMIAGLAISNKTKMERPNGQRIRCIRCSSLYNIHLPQGMNKFRCPVCNIVLQINI